MASRTRAPVLKSIVYTENIYLKAWKPMKKAPGEGLKERCFEKHIYIYNIHKYFYQNYHGEK